MRLIFCIDDKGGMMFFGKRQSKDSVLRNWIVNYAQGAKLWKMCIRDSCKRQIGY